MKIAMLGAGFAGLATAWMLLNRSTPSYPIDVTIFEAEKVGAGSSGVAAGLMHPFANVHSKLTRGGYEGFDATLELLAAAEAALGKKPYDSSGILRSAFDSIQAEEFHLASVKYPNDIKWIEPEEMERFVPGVVKSPGILIQKGLTVYIDEYLKGLWLACEALGCHYQTKKISALEELHTFDKIVISLGASTGSFAETAHLPLRFSKGQILELRWPEELSALPMALNGQIYCVMHSNKKRCLVGSTYEKKFLTTEVDINIAKNEILPKLAALYPPLEKAEILGCRAGIRVSTPQHLPLVQQINTRCFAFAGLGSKGLLYHALYAKKLCDLIQRDGEMT